jgi:molecular chaperone GrpE
LGHIQTVVQSHILAEQDNAMNREVMNKKEQHVFNNEETLNEETLEENSAHLEDEDDNLLSEVEALKEENEKLTNQLNEQKEEYVRKVADLDNFRKRLLREKEAAIQFANEKLINDLIPILDDFERAIESGNQTSDVKSYAEGVELIQRHLLETLSKGWGLKRMDDIVGKEFSPHEHEAMLMEESDKVDSEIVLAELQKGYYLHDRVLRTAKVKVGKPAH